MRNDDVNITDMIASDAIAACISAEKELAKFKKLAAVELLFLLVQTFALIALIAVM